MVESKVRQRSRRADDELLEWALDDIVAWMEAIDFLNCKSPTFLCEIMVLSDIEKGYMSDCYEIAPPPPQARRCYTSCVTTMLYIDVIHLRAEPFFK
jgi:hypothetical protein